MTCELCLSRLAQLNLIILKIVSIAGNVKYLNFIVKAKPCVFGVGWRARNNKREEKICKATSCSFSRYREHSQLWH